jgi:hypothetical protein
LSKLLIIAAALVGSLAAAAPARSEVHVSVNIGAPPVVVARPSLVVVPGSRVYYAPSHGYNLFFYSGRYYTEVDGAWFYAPRIGAAWVAAPVVPAPVMAVPVRYYRVPPGHHGPHCPPGQAKKGRC